MLIKFKIAFMLVLLPNLGYAERIHPEKWYQDLWCADNNGRVFSLPDGSEVDCLTDEYAVEVGFANKWQNDYGQAMFYAARTGKKPAILMIMEKDSDWRFLKRLYDTILYGGRPVKVWVITPDGKVR